MADTPPQSPADPRDGEPYYISSACPNCGTALILYDHLPDDQQRDSEALADPDFEDDDSGPWYDEWVCPNCRDGIHLDVPVTAYTSEPKSEIR